MTHKQARLEEIADLLSESELICTDINTAKEKQFSIFDILKGLVSVLKDERACTLMSPEEYRECYSASKNRGIYLRDLVKERSKRTWSEEEILELSELLFSIYGVHDREPIRLEDKLVLLSQPYICSREGCDICENLEIDHKIPVRRGGSSNWANLQWLCRLHNREKAGRIERF